MNQQVFPDPMGGARIWVAAGANKVDPRPVILSESYARLRRAGQGDVRAGRGARESIAGDAIISARA